MGEDALDTLDANRLVLCEDLLDPFGDLPVLSPGLDKTDGDLGGLVRRGEERGADVDDGEHRRGDDDGLCDDDGVAIDVRAEADLHEVVRREVRPGRRVGGEGREVLQGRVHGETRRECDALGDALDLVVQRRGALLEKTVALRTQLEEVGPRDGLADEVHQRRVGDRRSGLVLVQHRARY